MFLLLGLKAYAQLFSETYDFTTRSKTALKVNDKVPSNTGVQSDTKHTLSFRR